MGLDNKIEATISHSVANAEIAVNLSNGTADIVDYETTKMLVLHPTADIITPGDVRSKVTGRSCSDLYSVPSRGGVCDGFTVCVVSADGGMCGAVVQLPVGGV